MFSNIRSYLSRFSSFILFMLMVFAVGILLILAINSANNNNSSVNNNAAPLAVGESSLASDGTKDEAGEPTNDQQEAVAVSENSSTDSGYTAADQRPLSPTRVDLDSQDSVSIDASTNSNGSGRTDAPGVSTDTASLPSTGTGEVVFMATALVVITTSLAYWIRSRKTLNHQLLASNR